MGLLLGLSCRIIPDFVKVETDSGRLRERLSIDFQRTVAVKARMGKQYFPLKDRQPVYHLPCEGRWFLLTATGLLLAQFLLSLIPIAFCKLWFSNPYDLLTPTQMLWTKLLELILLCTGNKRWFFHAPSGKTRTALAMHKLNNPTIQSNHHLRDIFWRCIWLWTLTFTLLKLYSFQDLLVELHF